MNIVLWILQVLLALHTVAGAVWKLSNSEQTVPALSSIPHVVWIGLSAVELVLALALIAPAFNKRLGRLVPIAAASIAAEMLFYTGVYFHAGSTDVGQLIYWLVVAVICAFLVVGRLSRTALPPAVEG